MLLNRDGDIKRTRDLTRHVLLDGVGSTHWNDWFRHHDQEIPVTVRRLSFEDFNQNLAAARCGIGIAMQDNITAGEELAQGALVRPLRGFIKSATKARKRTGTIPRSPRCSSIGWSTKPRPQ
ncbi:hypothetical protein IB265_26175 [Ensifer sp. ENS10]|nr:hypothetical protein [Ensifer sp. ENS10]